MFSLNKSLLCIFLLCAFQNLNAQFGERVDLFQADFSVAAAYQLDFDSDGDLDWLSFGGEVIVLSENLDGQDLFAAPKAIQKVEAEGFPENMSIADLDGDGDEDLVLTVGQTLIWMQREGDSFVEVQRLENLSNMVIPRYNLQVADVDADGQIDVLVAPEFQNKIVWFRNEGLGNFASEQDLLVAAEELHSFTIAPLNSDDLPDILTIEDMNSGRALRMYQNEGGSLAAAQELMTFIGNNPQVEAIDMDGDSDLDVVVRPSGLGWLENLDGEANFASIQSIWNGDITRYTLGDLDNDGDLDLALINDNRLQWLAQNTDGTFSDSPVTITEFPPTHIYNDLLLADVDNDGLTDIVHLTGATPEALGWWKNEGGTFNQRSLLYSCGHENPIFGDVNGDDQVDLVLPVSTGYIRWMENIGQQNYSAEQLVDANHYYDWISRLQLADLDGDGDLDILGSFSETDPAYAQANLVCWYENTDGAGTYSDRKIIVENQYGPYTDVYAVDMDNDGDLDALVNQNDQLLWFEKLDFGDAFGSEQVLAAGQTFAYLNVIDLDNDDLDDLVFANGGGDIFWMKKIDDTPSFENIQSIISGEIDAIPGINFYDLDEDGDEDIVVADFLDNDMKLFLNDGAANFSLHQRINTFYDDVVLPILALDVDDDGDLDLLTSNVNGELTAWYENQGDLDFDFLLFHVVDSINYENFYPFDFDADGDLDLYTSNFLSIVCYESPSGNSRIEAIAFHDLNQDGFYNIDEPTLEYQQFVLEPEGIFSFTNEQLGASFAVNSGDYDLAILSPDNWALTSDSVVSISIVEDTILQQYYGLIPTLDVVDLEAHLISGLPRCNTDVRFWLSYANLGTTIIDSWIGLELDPLTTFVESSPMPDSMDGQHLFWQVENLPAFNDGQMLLTLGMPGVDAVGDTLAFDITAISTDSIQMDTFNTSYEFELLCAYDPNDKLVSPNRNTEENYLLPEEELMYTIRFQNTGNDTAFQVRLVDQLDINLDWSTFRPVSSSHSFEVTLDDTGLLEFRFADILLPDSMTNEQLSQGFVTYAIFPKEGIEEFTEINNFADIYFDFNPPIVTNTTLNTFVLALPTSVHHIHTEREQQFIFSPNPFQHHYSIRAKVPFDQRFEFKLYTLEKRLILSRSMNAADELLLSRDQLPSGLYLYQMIDEETGEVVQVGKVVAME